MRTFGRVKGDGLMVDGLMVDGVMVDGVMGTTDLH
jgi:hypothetical protein